MATNPLNPSEPLEHKPSADSVNHPQSEILPGDSAVTKAEKIERHGEDANGDHHDDDGPRKRVKVDHDSTSNAAASSNESGRQKGVAPIKKEFLVDIGKPNADNNSHFDDDAAEAGGKAEQGKPDRGKTAGRGGKKTQGGQNKSRNFGSSRDAISLCRSREAANEFAKTVCPFDPKCKHEHDIRRYLKDGKREDLSAFDGLCPVFEVKGHCGAGWRCRFAGSHSKEREVEDGKKELVQLVKKDGEVVVRDEAEGSNNWKDDEDALGIVNVVDNNDKIKLRKKQYNLPKSDQLMKWYNLQYDNENGKASKEDNRAEYIEPPFRPSEKRRIYYGPETPVLAPLTTQGNLPFRRLAVELGAQITWSEMAMGMPLIQGEKGEWALMKAHESEMAPPAYFPKNVVKDYDNGKDIRFGAQIAANKPWLALKTAEVLTDLCPRLRAIDLNCGCPIDLVCNQGAGSQLLDAHGKLEKMLRGMNTVSKEVPITVKIRMGVRDKQPTAEKLCKRLVLGDPDLGPAGVAAITLHGRSRQQRYTKDADWEYIAECASLVKKLREERDEVTDTAREPDARDLPATNDGMPYFCGNGDILSHIDYNTHIENAGVDSIMIGRGALVKPWLFEEISSNQYLDKSASERLTYIDKFVRNGLEYWGSDEIGVGTTRRFLLEWLSFTCRYVPIGLLEHLPPKFGDRPPAYKGRNELETLLSSANYKDWITISEMFLGKAHDNFQFQPKHKSNSYEIQAEG